ncbi:hypothetical protein PpBr36_01751 [Pyricularia pennisetigena]|uniref:hypothetical protein n=1 Tax=Pyricularia pennisetigena TaxID=1578925 RepID=UPI00114E6F04|nr:hypothetical protein PpBr36_01751 [Pyricularia pennisetigena]TLS29025.1 hypothetical protein PpBr36_01751 [Pyricularia pennisetigena]
MEGCEPRQAWDVVELQLGVPGRRSWGGAVQPGCQKDGLLAQQVSTAHALVDMNPRHHPLKVSGVSVGAAR